MSWWAHFTAFVRKHPKLVGLVAAGVVLFAVLSQYGFEPMKNIEVMKRYILGFGPAAPVFFIAIQVAQVLIAPIPGQAAGLAGGYVFGWKLGAFYSTIGMALGSLLVFVLSRKLGRAFVRRFSGEETLDEMEALLGGKENGLATFFLIMILPALPDDLVCFAAGLTTIPIWQLTIAATVGRFPGILALSLVGGGFSESQGKVVSGLVIGGAVVLTLLYLWKRTWIEQTVRKMVGLK